jgi:3,4-dihydroxy 2-butanone 4-phosphate synthase/GTP cyclohydrolase II
VICEIMKDDGTMARLPDLEVFAKDHGLRILSIADLITYRLAHERLVKRIRTAPVEMPTGKLWNAHVYQLAVDGGQQFLAMSYGTLDARPTLVRVHTGSVLADAFGVSMGRRVPISDAVARIEAEGRGAILFLPGRPDPASDLAYYLGEPVERAAMEQGEVLREYGIGAQVLADLGLEKLRILTNRPRRIPSLDGYGLEVVEQITLGEVDEDAEPGDDPLRTTH